MKKYPIQLQPVPKEIIWGGNRLKKEYNKKAEFDNIAESWELTVRNDEINIITNGPYKGCSLKKYIETDKTSVLGTNCDKYEYFPLLVKLIDAKSDLSIQVHPDDEYALSHRNEFGKTEMWYVIDAEKDSKIVYGLKDGITIEDFKRSVAENTVEKMLNYVPVKKGEVYFIPSGQVHAIGAGILIAEIQQNSNVTYRVYDYNRKMPDGSLRELHVDDAINVIKLRDEKEINDIRFSHPYSDDSGLTICSCDFFTSVKYASNRNIEIECGEDSFLSILVLEAGKSCYFTHDNARYNFRKGDSFFIPAGLGKITVWGDAELIVTKIN